VKECEGVVVSKNERKLIGV